MKSYFLYWKVTSKKNQISNRYETDESPLQRAFSAIQKAVEYGYSNFEKIKTYQALSWLRNHPQFEVFKNSGYRLNVSKGLETPASDDKLSRLERLARLKDQGIISSEEFDSEKQKILREN